MDLNPSKGIQKKVHRNVGPGVVRGFIPSCIDFSWFKSSLFPLENTSHPKETGFEKFDGWSTQLENITQLNWIISPQIM